MVFTKGKPAWNKGLTQLTDNRVSIQTNHMIEGHHRRAIRRASEIGKFTSDELQVLYGSLLGDGSTVMHKHAKNAIYTECHCLEQSHYLRWKAEILKRIGVKFKQYLYQCAAYSPALSQITEIHWAFYPNGKKIIPSNILENITPLGLAIWYMDDGCISKFGCRLCTHAFSEMEVKACIDMFQRKYGIYCRAQKIFNKDKRIPHYVIEFNRTNARKLWVSITPYIHTSMRYKIEEQYKW